MRPVAGGRPGTQVIPDGWAAAHAAPVAGTFTATIDFREPGSTRGEWDPAAGVYGPSVPHAPYASVSCRVQALTNDARTEDAADEQVTVAGYLVAIPADTEGLETGHLGDVSESGDLLLDGKTLRVDSIVRGSLVWERDLYCSLQD